MKALGYLILLFAWMAPVLPAATTEESFQAANKLYEQGKFSDAATAYLSILKQNGSSSELYYNLGNALFKSGQIGRAVYYYRLAELRSPRDPDIRANLHFARDTVAGSSTGRSRAWIQFLTINEWSAIAAVSVWIWFGLLLLLRELRPGMKQALRGYTATGGIVMLALLGLLGYAVWSRYGNPQAIVAVREAVVRLGPLEESQSAFTARDGSELAILDQNGEWLQVRDSARHIGWLPRKNALVFPPKS